MNAITSTVPDESGGRTLSRRQKALGLSAGFLFFVVPNSAFLHEALRVTLGLKGIQCC